MYEKTVKIKNTLGVHSRPASMIVQTACKFESTIVLKCGDRTSNARAIIPTMMLAACLDRDVTVIADGTDEKEAVEAIITVIDKRFNEE